MFLKIWISRKKYQICFLLIELRNLELITTIGQFTTASNYFISKPNMNRHQLRLMRNSGQAHTRLASCKEHHNCALNCIIEWDISTRYLQFVFEQKWRKLTRGRTINCCLWLFYLIKCNRWPSYVGNINRIEENSNGKKFIHSSNFNKLKAIMSL